MQVQYANPLGAFLGGQASAEQSAQLQQAGVERQRGNALTALMADYGSGLIAGDQEAYDALAAAGFADEALGYRERLHGMEFDNRQIGLNERRFEFDQEKFEYERQLARQQAEAQLAQIDLAGREAELEAAMMADERAALQLIEIQTPEQWEQMAGGILAEAGEEFMPFDQREILLARMAGTNEVVSEFLGQQRGGGLPDEAQERMALAGIAGLTPDDPRFQNFMLTGDIPGGAEPSAAEARIARLQSLTVDGRPVTEEMAIALADGVLEVSRNPVDESVQVVNKFTGQIVGQPDQPDQMVQLTGQQPSAPGQQPPQQGQPPAGAELSFGQDIPGAEVGVGAQSAFGFRGMANRFGNRVTDFVTGSQIAPAAAEQMEFFQALEETMLSDMVQTGYERQPAMELIRGLRQLLPQAGTAMGPQEARGRLNAMRNLMMVELEDTTNQLASGGLRPQAVSDLRAKSQALRAALARIDSGLERFEIEDQPQPGSVQLTDEEIQFLEESERLMNGQ